MEEKSMNELFYGADIATKQEQFKNAMLEIEKKHIEWFKERQTDRPLEEHDRLHSHWATYTTNGTVMFNFLPHSELPDYIKDECIEAFKKIYVGAKQNP